MSTTLIRGGRIIDPSQQIDRVGNLLLRDGRVVGIDDATTVADQLIEALGMIVCPGLIDAHVSFREPGDEKDETIESGTAAALAGGMTSVACMPDSTPVVDNRAAAEFVKLQCDRAAHCNVFPLGAVTKGNAGTELAEIGQLIEGGAVAFSDATNPIANAEIMRRALEYTRMFNRRVFNQPHVPELIDKGVMHEGFFSTLLGLRGMPVAAEEIMVGRDLALAELTGGRLHLMTISTAESVERIQRAKAKGIHVTAEVTPHHLALTDAELQSFDSSFKVSPPLRTQNHINALIGGLRDGTIDIICSDHQPYAQEKKDLELDLVPFGAIGLETLLPVCIKALIEPEHLTWLQLIDKLSWAPAKLLGLQKGTLSTGADADVTIIDPNIEWTIDADKFASKSRNTPFNGWTVRGRASMVMVNGQVRYQLAD
ncbi:MAG: dihydroorotase [Planctomycetaceae bacterium]|nr:dihydroorotase [Planctomycetaceae bacterium]